MRDGTHAWRGMGTARPRGTRLAGGGTICPVHAAIPHRTMPHILFAADPLSSDHLTGLPPAPSVGRAVSECNRFQECAQDEVREPVSESVWDEVGESQSARRMR